MKKLLLTLAFLLAAAVLGTWLYADSVARSAVEEASTQAFGTTTRVGVVTLGFLDASIGLSSYRVSGAGRFQDASLLHVNDAELNVGYGGIGRERVEADELVISGVELNLLMDGSGSNFGPVLRNLRGLSGGDAGASDASRFVIRRVRLSDLAVNVDVPGVQRRLSLPDVELKDVGGERGVWLSELAAIVMGAVMDEALSQSALPSALRAALGRDLGNLPDALGREARDRLRERLDEETGGLLEKAVESLQGKDDGNDG